MKIYFYTTALLLLIKLTWASGMPWWIVWSPMVILTLQLLIIVWFIKRSMKHNENLVKAIKDEFDNKND